MMITSSNYGYTVTWTSLRLFNPTDESASGYYVQESVSGVEGFMEFGPMHEGVVSVLIAERRDFYEALVKKSVDDWPKRVSEFEERLSIINATVK